MSQSLEKLCRPVVRAVCDYWYNMKAGIQLDYDAVRIDLHEKMTELREAAEEDPLLKREYARIELPLVFFIDYTMKESGFQFSTKWKEIARDYKEFSGDEKFFDLLSDSLDDPEGSEQLMMYYLFMGLGFDGSQSDREFVERRMKVCAARFSTSFHPATDPLSPPDIMTPPKFSINKPNRFFSVYTMIVFLCLLLGAAVFSNFYVFQRETRDYKTSLDRAVSNASRITDQIQRPNAAQHQPQGPFVKTDNKGVK